MANSIVSYVLQVNTDKGEANLVQIATAAEKAGDQLEKTGKKAKRASKDIKETGKEAEETGKRMRNLRRAGRDLDGALMDLGQGISLVNPAMGSLIMNLSDAASISEGVGRIGTLLVNPMFLGMAGIVASLGATFVFFNTQQEKAKAEAEALAKQLDDTNKSLDEQDKLIANVNNKLGSYIDQINNAAIDTALLSGALNQLEVAQDRATFRAEQFRSQAKKGNAEALEAAKANRASIQADIIALDNKLRKEKEAAQAAVGAPLRGLVDVQLSEEGKKLEEQLETRRAQRQEQDKLIQGLIEENKIIDRRADLLEENLQKKISINEQNRKRAIQEKRSADARRQADKQERENQKRLQADQKRLEQDQAAIQAAKTKLDQIGFNLIKDTLTEEEKIEISFNKQLETIQDLVTLSEDFQRGQELERQLILAKQRALENVVKVEEERLSVIDQINQASSQTRDLINSVESGIGRISSAQSFVSGIGGGIGKVGSVLQNPAIAAANPQLAAAGQVLGVVGEVTGAIGSLVGTVADVGSGVSDIMEEQQLTESEARELVFENIRKSIDDFLTDFARGIDILPDLLEEFLPAFMLAFTQTLRPLFMEFLSQLPRILTEALINFLGFQVASIIDALSDAFRGLIETIRELIRSGITFSREDRQSRRQSRRQNRRDRLPGLGAVIDSIRSFASGGPFIPHAAGGMRFTGTSRSGLAMLHQNEFVVPASGQRSQSVERSMNGMNGGFNITINSAVVEQNAIDSLVRKIEERFNNSYGLSSSNLFGGR